MCSKVVVFGFFPVFVAGFIEGGGVRDRVHLVRVSMVVRGSKYGSVGSGPGHYGCWCFRRGVTWSL